ncbi:MAG: hypothetical protein ABSD38_08840 [Syntrophorhabdales bacterium]|jgi:hypothetical protein
MAVEGAYNLEVTTPMGIKKGRLVLHVEGNSLSGTVTNMNSTNDFTGGKVSGDQFEFTAEGRTPMGPGKFEVKGVVFGDSVSGEIKIKPMGVKTKFQGVRE